MEDHSIRSDCVAGHVSPPADAEVASVSVTFEAIDTVESHEMTFGSVA